MHFNGGSNDGRFLIPTYILYISMFVFTQTTGKMSYVWNAGHMNTTNIGRNLPNRIYQCFPLRKRKPPDLFSNLHCIARVAVWQSFTDLPHRASSEDQFAEVSAPGFPVLAAAAVSIHVLSWHVCFGGGLTAAPAAAALCGYLASKRSILRSC